MEFIAPTQSLADILISKMAQDLSGAGDTWEKFKTPTEIVPWIREHFRVPETSDNRIIVFPYQEFALKNALEKENGNYKYSLIVYSDIKKSLKSCYGAAAALFIAFTKPWASIKLVANDLKQADSRQMEAARRCIELNPDMKAVCKVKPSGYSIEFPNHSKIEAIPIDPQGEAGGNDDAIFYSELWGMASKAAMKMWTEMAVSPTKYGKSFIWAESYAGFRGQSPLLENLYQQGVVGGRRLDGAEAFDPPLEIYENRAAGLFTLWNTTPRLPWQTPAYYSAEKSRLTDNEFNRIHRNQWGSSEDAFIPIEWWNGCQVSDIPPLNPKEPAVIAVDAAVESDCFAIVMVTGWSGGRFAVRYARAWYPPKGDKIHFRNEDGSGPEQELRRLVAQYNILEIAYDPFQLQDLAERFEDEGLVAMTKFGQQAPRLLADKQLFDIIRDRNIVHSGETDLKDHLKNANRKSEGEKLRIIKRSSELKIDLAVALSMAVDRARSWGL